MGRRDRALTEGEEVVLALRPHGKALMLPGVALVGVCAAAGWSLAGAQAGARPALLVVLALLLVPLCVVPVLRWRADRLVVTATRVLVRTGVLRRTGRDLPLSAVRDVSVSQRLSERVLGCGTLVLEPAGDGELLELRDVPRVQDVLRIVYQLVEDGSAARR